MRGLLFLFQNCLCSWLLGGRLCEYFSHLSCNPFLSLLEPLLCPPLRLVCCLSVLPEFPPHSSSYIHFLSDPIHLHGSSPHLFADNIALLQKSLSLSPESQPAFPAANRTPCLVVHQAFQTQPAPDCRTFPFESSRLASLLALSFLKFIHAITSEAHWESSQQTSKTPFPSLQTK